MPKKSKSIINLFVENEQKVSRLYWIYSKKFPLSQKFWKKIHAKNILQYKNQLIVNYFKNHELLKDRHDLKENLIIITHPSYIVPFAWSHHEKCVIID